MAWGLWNKIKQGFKKVGGAIKKAASFVNDKVIKPFKPIISAAASAFNPTLGRVVDTGMKAVEKFSDEGTSWGSGSAELDPEKVRRGVETAKSWASRTFK